MYVDITEHLARFTVETGYDALPDVAIREAKKLILDCVGVALAGSKEPAAAMASRFIQEAGGSPQASVIGQGFRTSAPNAALANGVAAHALDFDDTSWTMVGHPSAAILPAVLAVAEHRHASGRDVLAAYIVGVEVAAKIGLAVKPGHYDRGWHATATLGTLGATAAVTRLMGLDITEARHALGIGASQASGLRQNFGTMTKPLHAGQASRNGVLAAGLAGMGFTADQNIMESRFGFFNTLCAGDYDASVLASLGRPFDVVSPGVSIKRYPSCHGTSFSIDATIELVETNDVRPEDVASVHCAIPRLLAQMLIRSNPQSGLEGKFSLEFCLAVAVLERNVGLSHFVEAKVRDPQVRQMMQKVSVEHRDEPGEFGEVVLELHGGETLRRRVTQPKGSPENPLTDAEVVEKYLDCAGLVVTRELADRVMGAVVDLEKAEHITQLMEWLSCGPMERTGQ